MRKMEQEQVQEKEKNQAGRVGEAFITALLTFPLPNYREGGGESDCNIIPFILPNTPGVYYWGDNWLLSDSYIATVIHYHTTTLLHYYAITILHFPTITL